ncbi:unnamed protein product [Moneuplotes crassus]|uniref:Transmembrane protein n=1 Tax=Euplotes crassus TaxID=5936 RepID=A0AAD1U095_EUPCR|nr:unnamed protein product [Moneuplotes crassus]
MKKDGVQYAVMYLDPARGREEGVEEDTKRVQILKSLVKSIRGVFLSPIKISVTLSTVSWVILDIFEVRYRYIYSFFVTTLTFIPIFSPSILGIPAALYLYFAQEADWRIAGLCFVSYYFITSKIFTDIYSNELSTVNPFLLFLSLVNGLYVFDITGFVYGPMLICLSHATIDLMRPPKKNKRNPDKNY